MFSTAERSRRSGCGAESKRQARRHRRTAAADLFQALFDARNAFQVFLRAENGAVQMTAHVERIFPASADLNRRFALVAVLQGLTEWITDDLMRGRTGPQYSAARDLGEQ